MSLVPSSDRNLLFGILALQMDFISRDALIAAMNAWVLDKAKSLGQVLLEQCALKEEDRDLLEVVVKRHLALHGNDAERSLAALSSVGSVRDELKQVADPEIQASLVHVSAARPPEDDPYATRSPAVGQPTAPGLRYRILRPHAKGALGEVFVARDEELRREVALKEIQNRHADHPDSRARFLLEAEVTGGLEHPGVVPVYGLGRYPDGRPYYAMRFIKGRSFQEAIDCFHKADEGPRDPGERALAFRELLGRFVAVCNAVAYAHSRGVLHRDLKPPNIMLGKFGETLVVDWGLAKVVGQAGDGERLEEGTLRPPSAGSATPTELGAVVGTPLYMSPEQAAGKVEELAAASDIYSLGVVLYAVLTGRAPFEQSAFLDVARVLVRVQSGHFPPPREVKARVPRGLEAVCLKAMALKPEDRYATALDLAAEVEHWLADEPVSAYQEPWPERTRRWMRRHRALVASGGVAVLMALVALAALAGVLESTNAALSVANDKERAARTWAETNYGVAKEAVEEYLGAVTENAQLKQGNFHALRKRLLQAALPFYAKLAQQQSEDPEREAARGRAYGRLAYVHSEMGEIGVALAHYDSMQALFERLAADHPNESEYRRELAASQNNRGIVLRQLGRPQEALAALDSAQQLFEALTAEDPDMSKLGLGLAKCQNNRGYQLREMGRPEEALSAYSKAIELQERLVIDLADLPECRQDLASSYDNRAILLAELGRRDEALAAYGKALELCARLAADHPGVPEYCNDLAQTHNNQGYLLEQNGQQEDSLAAYAKALELYTRLAAAHPDVPKYRRGLAHTQMFRGRQLAILGLSKDALAAYAQALELFTRLVVDHPDVPVYREELADTHGNRGILLRQLDRRDDALAASTEALELKKRLAADHPDVPKYAIALGGQYCNQGNLLVDSGRADEALGWYGKAMQILQPVYDKDRRLVMSRQFLRNSHWGRAEALSRLARHSEALADWDLALELDDESACTQLRLGRLQSLARTGMHAQAVSEADALAATKGASGTTVYGAACAYAFSAIAVKNDASLRDRYLTRALELLRQAVAAGYKDAAHMQKDKDLDALRDREDFKKLLAELEAAKAGEQKPKP